MMRMMRGRWLWGILGAAATAYFLRRSRGRGMNGMRPFTSNDAYRMGQTALDSIVRAGTTLANNTMRTVSKQRR